MFFSGCHPLSPLHVKIPYPGILFTWLEMQIVKCFIKCGALSWKWFSFLRNRFPNVSKIHSPSFSNIFYLWCSIPNLFDMPFILFHPFGKLCAAHKIIQNTHGTHCTLHTKRPFKVTWHIYPVKKFKLFTTCTWSNTEYPPKFIYIFFSHKNPPFSRLTKLKFSFGI